MPIAKTHAYLISTKESDLMEIMIRANSVLNSALLNALTSIIDALKRFKKTLELLSKFQQILGDF